MLYSNWMPSKIDSRMERREVFGPDGHSEGAEYRYREGFAPADEPRRRSRMAGIYGAAGIVCLILLMALSMTF